MSGTVYERPADDPRNYGREDCQYCAGCGEVPNDDTGEYEECEGCNGEGKVRGPALTYVNVYLVNRAYGGPAEGGDWYTYGEPVESRLCDSLEEAIEEEKHIKEIYDKLNNERPPIWSVRSQGVFEVYREAHFAKAFPEGPYSYE